METKSERGKLVEQAASTYLESILFEPFKDLDIFMGNLQAELNKRLKFETMIDNLNQKDGILEGNIFYETVDDTKEYMCSHFTVVSTAAIP